MTARVPLMLGLFAVLAVVPPLLTLAGQGFYITVVTRMMIYAIAALSLDLILGYGALVSFGHAAFFGIGAYAALVLQGWGIGDLFAHFAAAAGAAALFALVTGAIALRTRGVYFIMISLAFGQMAFFFFVSLSAFGGDDGMSLPRSTLFGRDLLRSETALFYLVLALLVLAFGFLSRLTHSRFGRVLIGTREDSLRMEAVGFRILPYQMVAYVISAVLCALAGVLIANQLQYVSPALSSWQRSGEFIIMVVLGGVGNLAGAVAGALVTIGLEELMARFSDHWKLYFGVLLLAVVLFAPGGLTRLVAHVTGRGEGR
ncbi:branched-chain amino acid ABC transporter permease [Paenirhodobacter sp.]|uniref:branched-chain amino acid ABC transporter permease n=1 Tax=Paenirhodobacter sp. TaxID=1965326 RepID=UPI003B3E575F